MSASDLDTALQRIDELNQQHLSMQTELARMREENARLGEENSLLRAKKSASPLPNKAVSYAQAAGANVPLTRPDSSDRLSPFELATKVDALMWKVTEMQNEALANTAAILKACTPSNEGEDYMAQDAPSLPTMVHHPVQQQQSLVHPAAMYPPMPPLQPIPPPMVVTMPPPGYPVSPYSSYDGGYPVTVSSCSSIASP